ncbi:ABC transporter permease [Phocaeicola sp.]
MIKKIIHQLWNQRRMNGWIFIELVIVSLFLWTVIDPIYLLTSNHLIDSGYNEQGRYVLKLGAYNSTHGSYHADLTDSLNREAYHRIVRIVRGCPEVESFCISTNNSFPNSGSWSGGQYYADTTQIKEEKFIHAQWYEFIQQEGSNLFRTYGMKDANTGGDMVLPEDCAARGCVFISEYMAQQLFGTIAVVGKKIYLSNKDGNEIAGVFCDYKHRDYEQPYPLVVYAGREVEGSPYMHWKYFTTFSLKDGVDANAFERRFKEEVAPQLSIGNFYFDKLQPFAEVRRLFAGQSGVTNKLRLQYSLAGFALLCIFLGMVGTFWIRCNARRQEIGLMRSLGATRTNIRIQFLVEASLLVTAAFIVAMPIVLHHVHGSGFATFEGAGNPVPNLVYWQNQPIARFCIVTLLTYLILFCIALFGTFIPTSRAANILPADALRDE